MDRSESGVCPYPSPTALQDASARAGASTGSRVHALLPDLLADYFCGLLGHTGPVGKADSYCP